jgi:hypothetical protein
VTCTPIAHTHSRYADAMLPLLQSMTQEQWEEAFPGRDHAATLSPLLQVTTIDEWHKSPCYREPNRTFPALILEDVAGQQLRSDTAYLSGMGDICPHPAPEARCVTSYNRLALMGFECRQKLLQAVCHGDLPPRLDTADTDDYSKLKSYCERVDEVSRADMYPRRLFHGDNPPGSGVYLMSAHGVESVITSVTLVLCHPEGQHQVVQEVDVGGGSELGLRVHLRMCPAEVGTGYALMALAMLLGRSADSAVVAAYEAETAMLLTRGGGGMGVGRAEGASRGSGGRAEGAHEGGGVVWV